MIGLLWIGITICLAILGGCTYSLGRQNGYEDGRWDGYLDARDEILAHPSTDEGFRP